jgi:threonine dehydrogenase-like Zn-dependent dehydrogenase
VKVGPGVRDLRVDDRVVVYHIGGCGLCEECRRGYPIGCESEARAAYGWQRDGGHADYLLADEVSCLALPESLTHVDGALVTCGFATAYQGLFLAPTSGCDQLLVTGLDPVGLAAAPLGRALGASLVIGSDPAPERVALATSLGVVDAAAQSSEELDELVAVHTSGHGCEVRFDCSGNAAASESAVRTRTSGSCVFVGEGGTVTLSVSELLIHKQLTVHGSWVSSVDHMRELLEKLAPWDLHPSRS